MVGRNDSLGLAYSPGILIEADEVDFSQSFEPQFVSPFFQQGIQKCFRRCCLGGCQRTQPGSCTDFVDCCNCFIGRCSPAFPDLSFRKHQQHISPSCKRKIVSEARGSGRFCRIFVWYIAVPFGFASYLSRAPPFSRRGVIACDDAFLAEITCFETVVEFGRKIESHSPAGSCDCKWSRISQVVLFGGIVRHRQHCKRVHTSFLEVAGRGRVAGNCSYDFAVEVICLAEHILVGIGACLEQSVFARVEFRVHFQRLVVPSVAVVAFVQAVSHQANPCEIPCETGAGSLAFRHIGNCE